jgi:sugar/nucleoside kinase (ribokinase family)
MESVMFFYTTAFFIESNYEALKHMMENAQENGRAFGFNIAAGYLFEEKREQMTEIMKYCDFIICNKDDALACVKSLSDQIGIDKNETDREKIALAMTTFEKINPERKRVVIITDSSNSIAVASWGESFSVPAI